MHRAIELEDPAVPFSLGVVAAGQLLFLSGQTAIDPNAGRVLATTFEEEARQTLANLKVAVESAGGSLSRIVKVTGYLSNLEADMKTYNAVYLDVFQRPLPARTTVQASPPGNARIEVDAIVALD